MKKCEQNILIIGNGFDLAHGLPTSYIDFLNFSVLFLSCFSQASPKNYIETYAGNKVNNFVSDVLIQLFADNKNEKCRQELKNLLTDNIWYNHFSTIGVRRGNTWIDFEEEISIIIQESYKLSMDISANSESLRDLGKDYPVIFSVPLNGIDDIIFLKNRLLEDLNRFARALEIYLVEIVSMQPISIRVPEFQHTEYDKLICFNYTDTFERLYDHTGKTAIDYIHGRANSSSSLETNNLILGINEFVPRGMKEDLIFIEFKKYYQRIWKKTGNQYYKWLKDLRQKPCKSHIYIFGHSLDETDKDILCPYLSLDDADVTIYYHTKQKFGEQIKKLVNLLGEEDLVQKVHDEKIVFLPQQAVITGF